MDNTPEYWQNSLPRPKEGDHKYTRGQVIVLGGAEMTGAACLTAHAASRIGAGLVVIVSPFFDFQNKNTNFDPVLIFRNFMPHIIVREGMSFLDFVRQAEIKGPCIPVVGPGLGNDYEIIRRIVIAALKRKKPILIDADGLNAFQGHMETLLENLHAEVILTPHEGEFKRLFPECDKFNRFDAVEYFKSRNNAVLVLKGSKTIIGQNGRDIIVNSMSSPYLATAGSGDVLSGVIAGLFAQGMSAFEAASAGVWIHGRAGMLFGAGLIAPDLPDLFPEILQEVLGFQKKVS